MATDNSDLTDTQNSGVVRSLISVLNQYRR